MLCAWYIEELPSIEGVNVNGKTKFVATLLSAALISSVVYAAIILNSRLTTHSAYIVGSGAIELYADAACTTLLGNVTWGNIQRETTATLDFWIKNVGSDLCWVDWNKVEPWPANINIKVFEGTTEWPRDSRLPFSGGQSRALQFRVTPTSAQPLGEVTFTTIFRAWDSSG